MENDKIAMPSLTLEPDLEEKSETVVAAAPVAETPKIPEPVLTPEEQQIVREFAAKIDVENTAQIMQYGAGTQKKWRISPMQRLPMSAPRIWARWAS